eukprot:PhF_6_TR7950/c0_g1_i1/m.11996
MSTNQTAMAHPLKTRQSTSTISKKTLNSEWSNGELQIIAGRLIAKYTLLKKLQKQVLFVNARILFMLTQSVCFATAVTCIKPKQKNGKETYLRHKPVSKVRLA